jgi:hypothetical protein
MKSRSILRSLCIGAALLVPAGGLAVLGAGTAGATTTTLVSVSKVKIGGFVNATLIGTTLFKTTAVGTQQFKITNVTTQGGGISARFAGTLLVTIMTTSGTKSIHKVKIKTGDSILITGSTSGGFKGCVINLPPIIYSSTSHHPLKWSATTISLSGVTITGSPCTTGSDLASFIRGHVLDSTMTFSGV